MMTKNLVKVAKKKRMKFQIDKEIEKYQGVQKYIEK